MQNQQQSIQGILSIAALICLAVGWFNLFSPEINHLLSRKVFYVLIGASFFIQAPLLTNKNFVYAMYAAAAVCVVGAFIPENSNLSAIKTIGLLGGIILSLSNRRR
ncbi:hypothetical protein H3Z85_06110 [Chryseobacterium indologenes]|uniref:hypothetical protein n=1 Tax=Chryseobacterium indologenes TaxID=253 RepID=UPI0003E072D6|nr:hypothetical protein [Chryseobacterium indologenes]ATN06963.1 hypothetical protein CRN76_16895 [Chryseobacterium indologenes]AYY84292.1 hypothetical protein EGX91_06900 [Chryseobacterium indologenes]AYZ38040.1 hypothetical protein EGY07_22120 [Chryseobacterium indologenes]MBF6646963.1 hypothetical protein [Chryseobacterium indologenes]MBU3047695.1 hypothetical protein [Chryseobacterium indologenes]